MTKKDLEKFHRLFNELVQREVNGKVYYGFHVEHIDYCGGYYVMIDGCCLLHESDLVALMACADAVTASVRIHLGYGYVEVI